MLASFLKDGLPTNLCSWSIWLEGPMGWREIFLILPPKSLLEAQQEARRLAQKGWLNWAVFEQQGRRAGGSI
jgi:hypothetical protein